MKSIKGHRNSDNIGLYCPPTGKHATVCIQQNQQHDHNKKEGGLCALQYTPRNRFNRSTKSYFPSHPFRDRGIQMILSGHPKAIQWSGGHPVTSQQVQQNQDCLLPKSCHCPHPIADDTRYGYLPTLPGGHGKSTCCSYAQHLLSSPEVIQVSHNNDSRKKGTRFNTRVKL